MIESKRMTYEIIIQLFQQTSHTSLNSQMLMHVLLIQSIVTIYSCKCVYTTVFLINIGLKLIIITLYVYLMF